MALPVNGSTHLIPAYYSFYRPRKDEKLNWPSWLTLADGLPTLVVTHQPQVERRTGKVRRPETDVLPLCHATNQIRCRGPICVILPNYIKIGQTVAEIWRFNGFQNGGRPPSCICEIRIF